MGRGNRPILLSIGLALLGAGLAAPAPVHAQEGPFWKRWLSRPVSSAPERPAKPAERRGLGLFRPIKEAEPDVRRVDNSRPTEEMVWQDVPDPLPGPRTLRAPAPPVPSTGARALQVPNQATNPDPGTVGRADESGLITLHLDNIEIRKVLELLSRENAMNILVAPGVSGTVTVNLEQVTLNQALDAVLTLGGLTSRREGNLIYVFTPDELNNSVDKDARIATRVYHLNYIRSDDLEQMLRPFISPLGRLTATPPAAQGISESASFGAAGSGGGASAIGGAGTGGGMAGAGTTGGNSMAGGDVIVVQDLEPNLKIIDDIVRQLDIQPTQVLIEAVILSVELNRSVELGINFGVVDNLGQNLGIVGNGSELAGNVAFAPSQILSAGNRIAGSLANGFPSPTNGIKFGFIDRNVNGFIRALEVAGQIDVLASPRVLVLNKQRAEIQLGQRLGFRTLSQNLTSTVQQIQFINTGTLLRLRPFVSTDGIIRMEIHPERSSGEVIDNVPRTNTSQMTTNIMIPNGSTLVIGGLIESEKNVQKQGLPYITRIPGLGNLFGLTQKSDAKRELIVLLTPHIWTPGTPGACTPALIPGTLPAPPPPPGAPSPFSRGTPSGRATATRPPSTDQAVTRTALTPPPAARPAPAEVPEPAQRHVVRRGENFWTISRRYYGSGRYYMALWAANRDQVRAPDQLVIGMTVTVPPVESLDRAYITTPPKLSPTPPSASARPRTGGPSASVPRQATQGWRSADDDILRASNAPTDPVR